MKLLGIAQEHFWISSGDMPMPGRDISKEAKDRYWSAAFDIIDELRAADGLEQAPAIVDALIGLDFEHEWQRAEAISRVIKDVGRDVTPPRGIRSVAVGSNADDAERGDGSAKFRQLVERAARATPPTVHLFAPVASLSKSAVVRCARSLSAPIHATVSCYTAVAGGCGDCRGCYDRRRALAES